MTITSIQALLEKAVLGKRFAMQPGIHENYWGSTITGITPCDLNYGCDSGFLINTDADCPCNSFTVGDTQELMLED